MQLIYLYIDGYSNFQKAEFHFSQDFRLHYKADENVIEISDTHSRLPEHFWGDNINNLSIVVGNNGAGKTSLMQYLISIFLEAHGGDAADGQGIMIFAEANKLYGYRSQCWEGSSIEILLKSETVRVVQWLERTDVESILGKTKLIYLTNALSVRDTRRSLRYNGNRFAPLYDCSMGNLITSNIEKDMNKNLRKNPMGDSETEAYFFYEQYKQIKFVFDRRQHQICTKLKDDGFPVPVPKILYLDLLMGNQLSTVWEDAKLDFSQGGEIEKRVFQKLYPEVEEEEFPHIFLWKQLSRCAVWCAVRSAVRCMSGAEKVKFGEMLWKDDFLNNEDADSYREIYERIWHIIERVKENKRGYEDRGRKAGSENWEVLKGCHDCYVEFLDYIKPEIIERHFKIDIEEWKLLKQHPGKGGITFTVDTNDAEWFMEFLQKYRYICNPDYFLDFHWGLSSGENSLLSLFASFYYIFDADYTNERHGGYKILNKFVQQSSGPGQFGKPEQPREVQCDSVILLIDEADLTYHPEWQRLFIALLTAFLPEIYPPQCCQDIQIVLSTHSPILLSDVPQQNVIYLKYDPEKHCTVVDDTDRRGTFGQNIHLLFKDSFFLKEGTIGLFALRKMSELVGNLNEIEREIDPEKHKLKEEKLGKERLKHNKQKQTRSSNKSLRYRLEHECKPYAEVIAEPIIRRKVSMWIDELERKLSSHEQNDQVQKMSDAELERELDKLQRELNRRKIDR